MRLKDGLYMLKQLA